MKIKKVSDTQLMLLLTTKDLSDRNLNISDIASNSTKAQKLFRDIMTTAITEYGFSADESPIMIEAIPATDGITIIISKVSEDMNETVSLTPGALDDRKYITSPMTLKSDDLSGSAVSNTLIFSFENLDCIIAASARLSKIYSGTNMLYKYNNKYYLIIHTDSFESPVMLNDIELILSEYGKKYSTRQSELSKYLFIEHGEPIIKENAVKILSKL